VAKQQLMVVTFSLSGGCVEKLFQSGAGQQIDLKLMIVCGL
jgi:hypothetical protein